ncbi:hypothetical protein KKF84_20705 [Myxococcota bacterium]|nr:hypothetical protein [Myxococcota bacterium]MBU1537745.1 hypothetical protein [Myxococcota bacterium]
MKKLVAILSVALFALAFGGCKKKAEETTPEKTPVTDKAPVTKDATPAATTPAVTTDATPAATTPAPAAEEPKK